MHKNKQWKFIRCISLLHFSLATINTRSDLFVNYTYMDCWDISSKICVTVVCLIPQDHYPYSITGHIILHAKSEVQAQSDKDPCDMYVCNSLSNVAIPWTIHMPYVNTGCYQLEMVFVRAYLPWLQLVTHCTDLTALTISVAIYRGIRS